MLVIKKIRAKNILSIGNSTLELDLIKSRTTLITGKNGSGKSAWVDVIFFALYNRPYRNINKPLLINSINKSDLLVEVEFETNGKSYLVRRGIKPTIFEIFENDVLVNQDSKARDYQKYLEEHVLKLNHKSFSQIVLLGSAQYVPFMQQKSWDRKGVVDNLLDIEIFTVMSTLLKDKSTLCKQEQQNTAYDIDIIKTKIKVHESHNALIKKDYEQSIKVNMQKIRETKKEISKIEDLITGYDNQRDNLTQKTSNLQEYINTLQEYNELRSRAKAKLDHNKKDMKFYETHEDCPSCKQGIDPTFKAEMISTKLSSIQDLEFNYNKVVEFINTIQAKIDNVNTILHEISKIGALREQALNDKRYNEQFITQYEQAIIDLTNNHEQKTNSGDLQSLRDEYITLTEKERKATKDLNTMLIAAQLLKDTGIKSKIIKQYIPIINTHLNNYLQQMDFFVQFEFDEDFNEKIKSRYRDEFTYYSFSEGQKTRIDIALIFTWRAIATMRNSISCNLLILDETLDSSLDNEGVDELFKIIQSFAPNENIFVVSHKGEQLADKFDNHIRVELVKNFSTMK